MIIAGYNSEGELTIGACTNEQKGRKNILGHPVKEAPA